jgi:hypothetical protein
VSSADCAIAVRQPVDEHIAPGRKPFLPGK